ncbi:hypothetical protein M3661_24720 [Paenibacillus sp. MER 180]|uniref:hypothetical protein n=1 Tax=Paenibacillus TaxID=44249 RepID=UPI0012695682|nr:MULTISPECIES: hypothetical protein [Paenibacillus]MCM3293315.1 hypothetical protein [Paenibacillus sp. MER 180]
MEISGFLYYTGVVKARRTGNAVRQPPHRLAFRMASGGQQPDRTRRLSALRFALALGDGNGVTGRCSEFIFSEVGKKND